MEGESQGLLRAEVLGLGAQGGFGGAPPGWRRGRFGHGGVTANIKVPDRHSSKLRD